MIVDNLNKSVFSDEQNSSFLTTLKSPIDLLVDLCLKVPYETMKIVYLAEEIIEISKSIPSFIEKDKFIDMSTKISSVVHTLASYADAVQIGIPVSLDKEIVLIEKKYR